MSLNKITIIKKFSKYCQKTKSNSRKHNCYYKKLKNNCLISENKKYNCMKLHKNYLDLKKITKMLNKNT